MSFPYVLTLHQAPTDGADYTGFHFHIECHPPLRKPNLLKYLAGPEIGGGNFLSDTRPEAKAAELRAVPDVHYKARMRDPGALLEPLLALHADVRDEIVAATERQQPGGAGLGRSRRRRATRSTRSTSSPKRSSRDSPSGSRASTPSCWWPKGCPAAAAGYPGRRRRGVGRLVDHRRSDRRHPRPDVPEAQRVGAHGVAPNRGPRHVAARHRAGGADRDSSRQAAPVRPVVGAARRRRARAALQPADRRTGAHPAAAVDRQRASRTGTRRSPASFPARATSWPRSTRRSSSARSGPTRRERPTASRISTPRPAVSCTS